MDTDDNGSSSYMSVQTTTQETRNTGDMLSSIMTPSPDINIVYEGITNAIQTSREAQIDRMIAGFNNLAPRINNNVMDYMPNYGGSSSSSGSTLLATRFDKVVF